MSIDPTKYNADTQKSFRQFLESSPPVIYQLIKSAESGMDPAAANKAFSAVGQSDEDKQKQDAAAVASFIEKDSQSATERAKNYPPENTDGKDKKSGKFSIMSILKIVPIGMNIFLKFPKVMSGLQDMVVGLQNLITNGVITASELVPNFLVYSGLNFMLGVIHSVCIISNIKNLHICVVPYLCDVFLALFKAVCCSFVSILDSFIIKRLVGFPLYDLVVQGFDFMGEQVQYPDFIIDLCYRCKLIHNNTTYSMLNQTKTDTGKYMQKVVTKDVPPRIMRPLRQEMRGVSKVASLFNL